MSENLKRKVTFEEKRKRLKDQEKLLKEKEKISQRTRLMALGSLFVKAKISQLDEDVLLGALMEISEKANDENIRSNWKSKSTKINQDLQNGNPITISFKSPPSIDIKEQLRILKFKWNSFRGEYYGFGDRKYLSDLLTNHECRIEEIV